MKNSHLLSFLCGALAVLGLGMIGQSKAESSSHVYELRIYHPNAGKLPALEARFGKDTDRIFKKHNINALGYWIPNDNPNNLFIYIVQHPNKAEATKNWAAFQADPEWLKVKADTEGNGVLTDHVDSTYMSPTEYSRLK
jgi:hypothetical protein